MIRILFLACVLVAGLATPSTPQGRSAATEVDLQLVLAVDISYSMDPEEQRLQRDGWMPGQPLPPRENTIPHD